MYKLFEKLLYAIDFFAFRVVLYTIRTDIDNNINTTRARYPPIVLFWPYGTRGIDLSLGANRIYESEETRPEGRVSKRNYYYILLSPDRRFRFAIVKPVYCFFFFTRFFIYNMYERTSAEFWKKNKTQQIDSSQRRDNTRTFEYWDSPFPIHNK